MSATCKVYSLLPGWSLGHHLFEMLSCTHDIIDQPPGLMRKVSEAQHWCPHLATLTLLWEAVLGIVGSLHTRCRSTFLAPPCDR